MEIRVHLVKPERGPDGVVSPDSDSISTIAVLSGTMMLDEVGVVTQVRHRAEDAGSHEAILSVRRADGTPEGDGVWVLRMNLPAEDGMLVPDVLVARMCLHPGDYLFRAHVTGGPSCDWPFAVRLTNLGL